MGTSKDIERIERFMKECILFRSSVKNGAPLSARQWQLVKLKIYELIYEIETSKPPRDEADLPETQISE